MKHPKLSFEEQLNIIYAVKEGSCVVKYRAKCKEANIDVAKEVPVDHQFNFTDNVYSFEN